MLDSPKTADRADLAQIAAILWQRWWIVLAGAAILFMLMVAYLNAATYRYKASVKLTLAPSSSGSLSSSLGGLGGLASVANVRLPQGRGEQNFLILVQNLNSPLAAEVLMRDPAIVRGVFRTEWDPARRTWAQPTSAIRGVIDGIKGLLGLPIYPYARPNLERMEDFLKRGVDISEDVRKPIVEISYANEDPRFAQRLLTELVSGVDAELRRRALNRTRENIAYLGRQLAVVQLAESRSALAEALAAEEKERMAASSTAPFAGEPMSAVGVSDRPTWPRPLPFLAGSIVIGAFFGGLVALALGPRRNRAEW